ncbi:MAG: NAD-dependent epimerase/dehydratase family protein [Mucilaginibacter sp.]
MNKKVLITGYSGFVGRNLAEYLHQKVQIQGLSRSAENKPDLLNEVFTWDELSVEKLSGINSIVHLAGKAHDLKNTSDAAEYFTNNTGLTKTLFDLFIKSSASDFIYFSSVKAVADSVDGTLTETAVSNPKTPYGQSKQQAEDYLLKMTLPPDKRLFIIRPCMIHGPGNKGNLNLLYKFVVKRIPYPFAAFANKRSFLSIDNLSYIIERILADGTIPGGIYNLADDESLSTNEVVKIISETSGVKDKLWRISPRLLRTAAYVGDKLHLPLNSERLKKLTESYIVSNDKIKKALQITHLPLSSKDGLRKTIASFGSARG